MGSAASDFKGLTTPGGRQQGGSVQQSPAKSPFGGLYNDPRTSSTQSLTPSLPEYEEVERRRLLVIYIHGFMGNDTSFQSFPAHVHRYLKLALFDSHVVHSKIYPRYKTYKSIDVARDNFSTWLEPLENPKTDIVLVGHSMGGLLAADVVLKHPPYQHHQHSYFKHRILGTVNLDSPLLGMHPGIIVSGISSLFRKTETPKVPGEEFTQPAASPSITGLPSPSLSAYSAPSTMSATQIPPPPPPAPFMRPALTYDPNFNPNLPNDVHIEERTWWKNVVHFVKKHNSEGLIDAAANHIMSHMEFGGTMFDINALKTRYENVRKLEDVDDLKQVGLPHVPPQVRFIQYYTICNGFPKKAKGEVSEQDDDVKPASIRENPEKDFSSTNISTNDALQHESFKGDSKPLDLSDSERSSLELLSPEPMLDEAPPAVGDILTGINETAEVKKSNDNSDTAPVAGSGNIPPATDQYSVEDKALTSEITHIVAALDLDLPAIPDLPPQPEPVNLDQYTDKDARKLAEKESKRVQKAYAKAVKDREKAIKDREKIIEKRRKKQAQDAEKKAKDKKKKLKKEEAAAASAAAAAASTVATTSPITQTESTQQTGEKSPPPEWTPVSPEGKSKGEAGRIDKEKEKARGMNGDGEEKKQKKRRKFCNVPKSHGQVDPRWVGVFMKDMDEVAAHTGLFFAGEHYESLVGDVGNTIVEWVQADMTKQTILGLQ
ncbi:putative centrosomal protein KIAA1731 [Rosellinia necatrix]|uniref:Putative centrosomal protein KIAA1731 n=1 Tax=Rosellinia necatrix TaxID=77044 RepID=A0A1S7UNQ6_ROSNE|nr:putative centrosomal protein KIAA1731 [Rosellinia necatrix]